MTKEELRTQVIDKYPQMPIGQVSLTLKKLILIKYNMFAKKCEA